MSRAISCLHVWGLFAVLCSGVSAAEPFGIQVVDSETGRGAPLVELETVNQQLFVTDSGGWVAIQTPDLLDREVYFFIRSHGYEYPADGFGFRGAKLQVRPGGRARLEIQRKNIAERLYRVTGGGIYRDSLMLGLSAPIEQPLANAQVWGSDSVVVAVHRDRIYWFWGDTNRPSYPLGNFHVPGAISLLPTDGGLDPAVGIDLEYFLDKEGFAKPTAQLPGAGPTWISGVVVLPDAENVPRLYAHYVKVRQPMEVYEWGLIVFDDQQQTFRHVKTFPLDAPIQPVGAHTLIHAAPGEQPYVYFTTPLPYQRVPATHAALADHAQYEAYTCLQAGSTRQRPSVRRDPAGQPVFSWTRGGLVLDKELREKLMADGQLKPEELPGTISDVLDQQQGEGPESEPLEPHRGSVSWNEHRQRWIMIFTQLGGKSSLLGEIWYAEADALTGPWLNARKILTHDKYSFYNPRQHPFFDQQGGRIIYFEGTYTQAFSAAPRATPLYDYNQVMYRLDLASPRLLLPPQVELGNHN